MLNLFSYDFMQRAFLAVIAMSLFSPILGTFLILRRQSLMSDTLSHVSLAGVAFGLVLGLSPTLTTVLVVIVAAVFLEYLRTIYKNFMEIGTAILMSTGLAISLMNIGAPLRPPASCASGEAPSALLSMSNDHDRRHVHGAAVQMHHCDGPGAGRDGRSQRIRIQTAVIGSRLYLWNLVDEKEQMDMSKINSL